jgi:hypothetical protein
MTVMVGRVAPPCDQRAAGALIVDRFPGQGMETDPR